MSAPLHSLLPSKLPLLNFRARIFHPLHSGLLSLNGLRLIASCVVSSIPFQRLSLSLSSLGIAKIHALVDLEKPLPPDVVVRDREGNYARIDGSYDRLPPLCSLYSCFSHYAHRCPYPRPSISAALTPFPGNPATQLPPKLSYSSVPSPSNLPAHELPQSAIKKPSPLPPSEFPPSREESSKVFSAFFIVPSNLFWDLEVSLSYSQGLTNNSEDQAPCYLLVHTVERFYLLQVWFSLPLSVTPPTVVIIVSNTFILLTSTSSYNFSVTLVLSQIGFPCKILTRQLPLYTHGIL